MAARKKGLLRGGVGGETAGDAVLLVQNRAEPQDERAEALARTGDDREKLLGRVRNVLASTIGDVYTDEQVDATVQDLLTARQSAKAGLAEAIRAGRALNRIQDRLGPKGYRGLVRARLALMPEALASYCRTIAKAVDERKIAEERLPAGVRPAYEVAKLEPLLLKAVAERVQLGPATTVREIKGVVKALQAEEQPPETSDRTVLEQKLADLVRRRDSELERVRRKYADEIKTVEEQLAALAPASS